MKSEIKQKFIEKDYSGVVNLLEDLHDELCKDEDLLFYYLVSTNELFVETNDVAFLEKAKKVMDEVSASKDAGLLRLASLTYLHSKDYPMSIVYAHKALKIDVDPSSFITLGNAYRASKKFEKAISSYQRAIHDKSIIPEINLFELYKQLDREDEAREIAQYILKKVNTVPNPKMQIDLIKRIKIFLDIPDAKD